MIDSGEVLCHGCGEVLCDGRGEGAEPSLRRCPSCDEELLLFDRYLLRCVLGSNVGRTFLATDTRAAPPRSVVIKELSYGKLDAWKSEDLFQREIDVLRRLDHPQIPAYLDDFALGPGKRLAHYLVQEHIEGESLREELTRRRYDEAQVLEIVDQVLEVLEHLQGLQPPLIHRDLKPSNLLRLPGSGRIAVIDFGAVRDLLAPASDDPTVAGTFGFMAPEQFRGEAFLQTDLYAVGAVALNLLTHLPPRKLLDSSTRLDWRERAGLSAPVERLLEALLAPEVEDRPENARAARALLAEVRGELGDVVAREPLAEAEVERASGQVARRFVPVPTSESTRGPMRGLLLAGAVGALVLGLGVYLFAADDGEPDRGGGETVHSTTPREPPSTTKRKLTRSTARRANKAAIEVLQRELKPWRWEGDIDGDLRFVGNPGYLNVKYTHRSGRSVMLSARAGSGGTLTLVLLWQQGDASIVTTYTGRLSADRKTLAGTYERVRSGGGERRETRGKWAVRPVGRYTFKDYPHTVAKLWSVHVHAANHRLVPMVRACYDYVRKRSKGANLYLRRSGKADKVSVTPASHKTLRPCLLRAIDKARFPAVRSKQKSFYYILPL